MIPIGFLIPLSEVNALGEALTERVTAMDSATSGWSDAQVVRMTQRMQASTNTRLRLFGVEVTGLVAGKLLSGMLAIWFVLYNASEVSLRAIVGLEVTLVDSAVGGTLS